MGKFINPFTDYGFKRIFGQEFNKDILMDFLNDLLEGERIIKDINYTDKEVLAPMKSERNIIFDIYCTTDSGEHIIVEMQNGVQKHFKDRALYYISGDIHNQGVKGRNWKYELVPVYGIYFMNWHFEEEYQDQLRIDIGLTDLSTGKLFSDKMRMIFIQIPLMTKSEDECETNFERWIYVLKNMETLSRMPFAAQKAIFDRLGNLAMIEAMPEKDRNDYEESLRVYRDSITVYEDAVEVGMERGFKKGLQKGFEQGIEKGIEKGIEQGIEKGIEKGIEQGIEQGIEKGIEQGIEKGIEKGRKEAQIEFARKLKWMGMDTITICEASGLSAEDVAML